MQQVRVEITGLDILLRVCRCTTLLISAELVNPVSGRGSRDPGYRQSFQTFLRVVWPPPREEAPVDSLNWCGTRIRWEQEQAALGADAMAADYTCPLYDPCDVPVKSDVTIGVISTLTDYLFITDPEVELPVMEFR